MTIYENNKGTRWWIEHRLREFDCVIRRKFKDSKISTRIFLKRRMTSNSEAMNILNALAKRNGWKKVEEPK